MALIDQQALGFKFISTGGWTSRAEGTQGQEGYKAPDLTTDEKSSGDIIFIEPLKQIYVGGTYFGVTEEQASTLIELNTKVGALENKVGTTEALSSTLLVIANDLKSKLDGGNYLSGAQGIQGTAIAVTKTVEGQQVAVTNVTEAVNELFTRLTSMVSGVQSVNSKTGEVVLSGDDYTISFGAQGVQGIQAVMNNVGTAVSTAQSTADGKISKSSDDTTAKTISGATGSALVDAAAIATAIETACERLLKDSSNQDQTNWGDETKKTLTTLRNLIAGQQSIIAGHQSTLENTVGSDWESIKNSITAIKNELGGTETDNPTRNLVGSLLDAVGTILPSKNNDNTYTFTVGESTNTASSIQGAIDKIVTLINNAAAAGVTQITEGDGINASNSGVGNVTVSANAGAKLTGTIGSAGDTYGLKGTQGTANTVQNALTGLNNEVITASTTAANAVTAAAGAQSAAESALTQLKWVVV